MGLDRICGYVIVLLALAKFNNKEKTMRNRSPEKPLGKLEHVGKVLETYPITVDNEVIGSLISRQGILESNPEIKNSSRVSHPEKDREVLILNVDMGSPKLAARRFKTMFYQAGYRPADLGELLTLNELWHPLLRFKPEFNGITALGSYLPRSHYPVLMRVDDEECLFSWDERSGLNGALVAVVKQPERITVQIGRHVSPKEAILAGVYSDFSEDTPDHELRHFGGFEGFVGKLEKQFHRSDAKTVDVRLYSPTKRNRFKEIEYEDVRAVQRALDAQALRSLTLEELLAVGEQYPELQCSYDMASLDVSGPNPDQGAKLSRDEDYSWGRTLSANFWPKEDNNRHNKRLRWLVTPR
jgi:hypothetical protein